RRLSYPLTLSLTLTKLSKNQIVRFPSSVPCCAPGTWLQIAMVGPGGLEPPTPRLSSACSNQLSYEPVIGKASNYQPCFFQGHLSAQPLFFKWWSRPDSNRRHPACKAGALPTELRPQNTGRK